MSHSVEMSVALNTEQQVKVCNDVLTKMNSFSEEYVEVFGKQINEIKASIKELKEFASNAEGIFGDSDNGFVKYQLELDAIKKKINNIKSINLSKYLSIKDDANNADIKDIVVKNGIMATLAIQKIQEQSINLNATSLTKMIDEIRTQKDNTEALKEESSRIQNFIFDGGFDEMTEEYLLGLISTSQSPQLLMDLYALMGYMETDKIRVSELYTDVSNILKTIDFSEVSSIEKINENGEFSKTTIYRNKSNKEFKMRFTSKGIDYKMGNYDKHLCESDSEEFMEILKKDFSISNIRIVRNQSNDRPMLKQIKSNERKI
ncbi:MAG: hypothetical protein KAG14_01335 [Mycoplasmataceae bacterium]|nr:hypothetical protein [Mycoplasmataceae bacterium]